MKNILPGVILSLILLCAACQAAEPVCPEGAGTLKYLDSIPDSDLGTQLQLPTPTPAQVEIGGKAMRVDKVVQGPLCIDTWQGVVYVTCDVQVLTWKDQPLFLKDCKLKIEPGTIVYVADHNDTAYYNGCSCHTGEEVQP